MAENRTAPQAVSFVGSTVTVNSGQKGGVAIGDNPQQLVGSCPNATISSHLTEVASKGCCKTTKKSNVFTLRETMYVNSVEILKQIIKNQLTHDKTFDFDVGYIQGAAALLWCDGLNVKGEKWKKSSNVDTGSSDDVVKLKKSSDDAMKQKAVIRCLMNYKINMDRGGGFDCKRSATASLSQLKSIDVRNKYYKQLSKLSTLKSNGILTAEEFEKEKKATMLTLKGLNCC
uniref:SHOCT domain-containing protein n=1 Tax=Amphimedon queenslandica TaxID=400682 RepID=A0A1X7ST93_AMPQE